MGHIRALVFYGQGLKSGVGDTGNFVDICLFGFRVFNGHFTLAFVVYEEVIRAPFLERGGASEVRGEPWLREPRFSIGPYPSRSDALIRDGGPGPRRSPPRPRALQESLVRLFGTLGPNLLFVRPLRSNIERIISTLESDRRFCALNATNMPPAPKKQRRAKSFRGCTYCRYLYSSCRFLTCSRVERTRRSAVRSGQRARTASEQVTPVHAR